MGVSLGSCRQTRTRDRIAQGRGHLGWSREASRLEAKVAEYLTTGRKKRWPAPQSSRAATKLEGEEPELRSQKPELPGHSAARAIRQFVTAAA
ncbi:hypothetical protein SBA4_3780008 [Candidatus Sulfopaludibacter sp. SbA4]|nr:hypothetical protein SBA4_3780008 [Candidatus Sulfopaludibacter sp. SbA4]